MLAYSKRYPELVLTVIQSSHHRNRLLDGLGGGTGGTGGGEGGSPLDIFSGEEEVTTVRIPFLATTLQPCRRSHNVFSPAPTTTIFPFLARLLSLYALSKKKDLLPEEQKKSPGRQAQCSSKSGGKKQVLDERHSGNKDLEAVFNDVFRRCATIGAQLSRDSAVLEFVFSQLKEDSGD